MFSSLSALLIVGLAMSANARPGHELFKRAPMCPGANSDDCYRNLFKSNPPAGFVASRDAACSTFLLTTVSGCIATSTSTAATVTSTTTAILTSGSTTTTTSTVTANVISTVRETSTTTTSLVFAKRLPDSPVTGTVSQEPAACAPATTVHDTAVPTNFQPACKTVATVSKLCSCAVSGLVARTTTTSAGTSTTVTTPTAVALVFSTTTTVVTETEFSTTTVSATTTTTLVATATIQPTSGLFFVSTNEGSTISADASAANALRADMTNNAVYFKTDSMSKLMSGNTFAGLIGGNDLISLSSAATEAEKISCRCANQAARTGAFTCRSSTGSTILQLCANNSLHLATTVVEGCRAIIANCNAVTAT